MKRFLWLIALMLAPTAFAQVYPANLAGLPAYGSWQKIYFVQAEQYQPPWSVPFSQSTLWIANLFVTQMPPLQPPLNVQYECLASATTGECLVYPHPPYINGYWPWDSAAGSYIRANDYPGSTIKEVDAFVYTGVSWEHFVGALEYTGACCPWYDWQWYLRESQVDPEPFMIQLATE